MGLSVEEFYNMIPRHFWIKMDGFYEYENLRQQQEWIRCRWMTTYLLNVQLPRNKSIKPQELIKFEWETGKEVDVEKLKQEADYYKNLDKHNLKKKDGE